MKACAVRLCDRDFAHTLDRGGARRFPDPYGGLQSERIDARSLWLRDAEAGPPRETPLRRGATKSLT